MNIIGGVDRAISGKIYVDEQEITSLTDNDLIEYRRSSIGFIFQLYNLVPNLTVSENTEVISNISKEPLVLDKVLSADELSDMKHRFPRELSGGEQQRVSIARANIKTLIYCCVMSRQEH